MVVPDPAATEIDGLRRALGDASLGRMPAHVTLVPPVNVRDVDGALAIVREAAARSRPIRVRIGPPRTFLPDSPVVYLEVGGDLEAVESLHADVMRAPLARSLPWPFVPHVTLVDEADPRTVPFVVDRLAGYEIDCVLDSVDLLEEGDDRVWRTLESLRLEAPAVVGRGGLPLEISVSREADLEAARWADAEWSRHGRHTYEERWSPEVPVAVSARREGRVVGLAEGKRRGDRFELSRLMVGAAERGQGVGSHLLARVESVARAEGCASLRLRTPSGSDAESFFSHRGFERGEVLRDWRHGRDFVVMVRDLR